MSVPGDFNNMTIEGCTSSCLAAGYQLAGVEYGRECYCASTGDNHGNYVGFEDAGCNRVCTGNNLEICGGEDRISVYSYTGPPTTQPGINDNLIQNPGFENNGLAAWTVTPEPTYGAGQTDTSPFQELYAYVGYDGGAHTGGEYA